MVRIDREMSHGRQYTIHLSVHFTRRKLVSYPTLFFEFLVTSRSIVNRFFFKKTIPFLGWYTHGTPFLMQFTLPAKLREYSDIVNDHSHHWQYSYPPIS